MSAEQQTDMIPVGVPFAAVLVAGSYYADDNGYTYFTLRHADGTEAEYCSGEGKTETAMRSHGEDYTDELHTFVRVLESAYHADTFDGRPFVVLEDALPTPGVYTIYG